MRYALGIDLGTGSTKAVLFDEAGDLVGRGSGRVSALQAASWVGRAGSRGVVARAVRVCASGYR